MTPNLLPAPSLALPSYSALIWGGGGGRGGPHFPASIALARPGKTDQLEVLQWHIHFFFFLASLDLRLIESAIINL